MLPRRAFLAGLAGAMAGVARLPQGVPSVSAHPTVFHRGPDAAQTLVRFLVRSSEAPAGRLRVFDPARGTLLGTAGMLPSGDRQLAGELWLPLPRRLRIRTEFEYPGTRRPLTDQFTLEPTPRWTVHWLPLLTPEDLERQHDGLSPLLPALPGALLAQAGARVDPLALADPVSDLDAARSVWPAAAAAARRGVPLAPYGSAQRGFATLPAALAGSGVAGCLGMLEAGWFALESAPTSAAALERALHERLDGAPAPHEVLMVSPHADTAGLLDAWHGRHAWPALSVGTAPASAARRPLPPPALPDDLSLRAARRREAAQREALATFAPLAHRLGGRGDPLAAVAGALRAAGAGLLVFNSAPWSRTDVVAVGGGERVVTDVPGPGYALLPGDAAPLRWDPAPWTAAPGAVLRNDRWDVVVDARGAIGALVHRASGVDLAGPGGLNAAAEGTLTAVATDTTPGLGRRVRLRRAGGGQRFLTTITLYDGLDTVDIRNDGGPWDGAWRFDLPAAARLTWAEPLRAAAADDVVTERAMDGWFAAVADRGALMVACVGGGTIARDAHGTVTCRTAATGSAFRLGVVRVLLPDDPWRLAAVATPLVALPASGGGAATLPGFGRLLELQDSGARVLGIRPAADGAGTIIYVHDLVGVARHVTLAAGVFGFTHAWACDLVERDQERLPVTDGRVAVAVPAGGVAAVRVLGG